MADFSNGLYTITSASCKSLIGRHFVEDLSLMPKRVLRLPSDHNRSYAPNIHWAFIRDGDGYILKALGAPTADLNGHVFANLLDNLAPTKWKIAPVLGAENPENAYTIKTEDEQRCWAVKSDDEYSQVAVSSISSPVSKPYEIFIIKPLTE